MIFIIMIKKFLITIFVFYVFFIFSVKAKILVSIKPLGFIVFSITDDIVPLDILLPYGESEHNYFLKPSDLRKIRDTDLLIWIGPEIESFLIKPSSILSKKNNLIISEIPEVKNLIINSISKNNSQSIKNMHLWLSPKIANIIALSIYKKLSILIPEKKELFLKNLKIFEKELNILDKKIYSRFKLIKTKKYIVLHDAFIYFEKYYGLNNPVFFITSNPVIAPGIKIIYKMQQEIIKNNVSCIFLEPQYKYNFLDNILKQYQIKKGMLDPLGNNIILKKNSYITFLLQLSDQYVKCLKS